MENFRNTVTTKAACEVLGICSVTLRNWTNRGLLKHMKLPGAHGHRRYRKADLDALLRQAVREVGSDDDNGGS